MELASVLLGIVEGVGGGSRVVFDTEGTGYSFIKID